VRSRRREWMKKNLSMMMSRVRFSRHEAVARTRNRAAPPRK